ncbi:MAG: hypothetical protein AAFY11_15715, partial [Cyanobacteria bacterium J06641_5]
ENPWIVFGTARLHEAQARLEEACALYRQILHQASGNKLISQARQGIVRIERLQADRYAMEIATARDRGSTEPGLLVLTAVPGEDKQAAARSLARVTGIDVYAARLQIPSRGLRPLRVGPLGELEFFAQSLQHNGVPCFCCSQATLQAFPVVPVAAIEPVGASQALAHRLDGHPIAFAWAEIQGRVVGEIPLPGEIVEINQRSLKTFRKTDTLDYARFCDLHLGPQQTILRLSDRHYDFQHHADLCSGSTTAQVLTRTKWDRLLAFITGAIPTATPCCSDFDAFARTVKDAMHLQKLLLGLETHIDLSAERVKLAPAAIRQEALWDAAFMLYSALSLLQLRLSSSSQAPAASDNTT